MTTSVGPHLGSPGSACWWNGESARRGDVRVPVATAAFRYGHVVFEGIPLVPRSDGEYLAIGLAFHLARLRSSCDALGMTMGWSDADLRTAIASVVAADRPGALCGLRVFAFAEHEGFLGNDAVGVCVFLLSLEGYAPDHALRLDIGPCRPADTELPRTVKATAHYAGARRSVLAARAGGWDDVLFRNEHGRYTETSRATLVLRHGSVVSSPPPSEGVLAGITWRLLAGAAQERAGLEVIEQPLTTTSLATADAAVLCSSSLGVVPVARIGDWEPRRPELADALVELYEGIVDPDRPPNDGDIVTVDAPLSAVPR